MAGELFFQVMRLKSAMYIDVARKMVEELRVPERVTVAEKELTVAEINKTIESLRELIVRLEALKDVISRISVVED